MRKRRATAVFIVSSLVMVLLGISMPQIVEEGFSSFSKASQTSSSPTATPVSENAKGEALVALETLPVKGRASKTGYERSQFGDGWATVNGCSTRDIILYRDLINVQLENECKVTTGALNDPYTGAVISFSKESASAVQIDHVIALSDAWQKGAQELSIEQRKQLANDPLELLAVDGPANQQKSDGDAATWLPKNKAFRCEYIARQIAVKVKYTLWVTASEKDAMMNVLGTCPDQLLP